MKVDAKITGLRELDQALAEFPRSTSKNVMTRALAKAAKPIIDAAVANAPQGTGVLKKSIGVVPRRNLRKKDMVLVVVGPKFGGGYRGKGGGYQVGSDPGVYGFFVEFGTNDTAAHPFLRPAWDSQRGAALGLVTSELRIEIDKAASRAARKAARKG